MPQGDVHFIKLNTESGPAIISVESIVSIDKNVMTLSNGHTLYIRDDPYHIEQVLNAAGYQTMS